MAQANAGSPTLLLLVGLALMGAGGYLANRSKTLVEKGEVGEGTVIALRPVRPNEIDSSYGPVVRFRLRDGEERTFETGQGSSPPAFRIGERVEVLYDPRNPAKAMTRAPFQLWGWPIIIGAIGLALAVGAVSLLRSTRRRHPPGEAAS